MSEINIVLVEPEIPQNTGNIARTCAATGARLHIVKPMGFTIDDKKLKRAGLDYWYLLDLTYYESIDDFFEKNPDGSYFFFTTKARKAHSDVQYPDKAYLIFGKETKGLPEDLLEERFEQSLRMPMKEGSRSLNLSNTVAIAVYEAMRQRDFVHLKCDGEKIANNICAHNA